MAALLQPLYLQEWHAVAVDQREQMVCMQTQLRKIETDRALKRLHGTRRKVQGAQVGPGRVEWEA